MDAPRPAPLSIGLSLAAPTVVPGGRAMAGHGRDATASGRCSELIQTL